MTDKNTFEKVYLKYYPILIVYGKTIVQNEQLVEDTIQELFIILWQKRENLILKSSIENYIIVSFRNNLIRNLKKTSTTELPQDVREPEKIPEIKLERESTVAKLINQLPKSQREVIFLRFYKNKSYQEIAEILGIQYQVARNFSYRAIKFLKKNMLFLFF
jgi:RNA polymerase sigma factor (sigma-70 family)